MNRWFVLILASATTVILADGRTVVGQETLQSGAGFTQTFDSIGGGLPTGFTVRTGATSTSLGTVAPFTAAATQFSTTIGQFANFASATSTASNATAAEQASATNRALGVRQTAAFGDPGAAFTFQGRSAGGTTVSIGSLSFDAQTLSEQGRTTIFTARYAVGADPTAFTNLTPTFTTGAFGSTTLTYDLSGVTVLQNTSDLITLQIVALSATTGSGSRDTFAIDNFALTGVAPVPEPATVLAISAAGLGVVGAIRRRRNAHLRAV